MNDEKEPEITRVQTFVLKLTKYELLHLRDLFNIQLPPQMQQTVSQALAHAEDRVYIETKLWNKVSAACMEANLPMEESAPDFVVTTAGPPPVSVFRIPSEDSSVVESANIESVFNGNGACQDSEDDDDDDDSGDDE